ncbi:hypothetical protein [Helicobacter cynogastricus]|uniref:hypothetical protein n=1 Tax=Helicobacter cynogastricus TaxID=329937 RepID=UPI000CF141D6|nr:hypothetical protein [Helicobacter cynogastricus]
MMRFLVMWFCAFALSLAHPSVASYLDGSFFSVGVDLGGGDALESERVIPSTDTTKQQIYKTNLQSYDEAINNLKNNQANTIAVLKSLAQQLTNLDPNSPTLSALVNKIEEMIIHPSNIDLEALTSSVNAYNTYLQQTLTQYKNANKQLLLQSRQAIDNYAKEVDTANAQNKLILQNALTTIDNFNNAMSTTAKKLNITYTSIPLPKSLQNCGAQQACIDNLSPRATIQALSSMSESMNNVVSVVGNDINALDQANQQLAVQYASQYSKLKADRENAINDALNDVGNIVKIVARGFTDQWTAYGVGQAFSLSANNGQYVNAADTCVFQIIIHNNASGGPNGCSYGPGTTTTLNSFKTAILDYNGLTAWALWDSIFNLNELQGNVYITPSDCSIGNCAGVPAQQSIDGIKKFFTFIDGYIGNNKTFRGNFFPSNLAKPSANTLYGILDNELEHNQFTLATNLVNAYTNTFIPKMLNMFQENPVWLMSVMPSGSLGILDPQGKWVAKPLPNLNQRAEIMQKIKSPALEYCYNTLTIGFQFSQGNGVCDYSKYANAIFLGYFGYVDQVPITKLTDQLNIPLASAQTDINNANVLNAQLGTLEKPTSLSVPPPSYSTQLAPMPTLPNINVGGTPLPHVIRPKAPFFTFSSRNLDMHPLQMGLQAKWGYQKYFTPFFGMSYYSAMSYRYLYLKKLSADNDLNAVNHYGFGIGTNLLLNFYSKIIKPKFGHLIIHTYGLFTGLMGMFNLYNTASLDSSKQFWIKSANLDGVFGFSMRVDRFKWMLGARVPLIDANQTLSISDSYGTDRINLVDNYKSTNLFLDFLTFF